VTGALLAPQRTAQSPFPNTPLDRYVTLAGLEGGSLETIRQMVASGVGVTVLPCTATQSHNASDEMIAMRPFKGTAPSRQVAIAWRKNFPRPRAIEAVRQAVMACNLACVEKFKPRPGA
jgi:LysR family hydrogen peroxide-inducible transcriptional activator